MKVLYAECGKCGTQLEFTASADTTTFNEPCLKFTVQPCVKCHNPIDVARNALDAALRSLTPDSPQLPPAST